MDPEQEYEDYEEQNNYDYSEDIQDLALDKKLSSENPQYNQNDLLHKVVMEAKEINNYTAFGEEWALLYYHACGWKKQLCQELMGLDEKHKKIINYVPQFSDNHGYIGDGDCMLCCEENKPILRNLCGEQFCEFCWKNQLQERLRTYYTDPFPPCINDGCMVKVSPKICFYLSEKDETIKKLFSNTICRSYATYNSFVKICKGKPGIQCNKCFAINKLLDAIECDTCGSVICPRCGEEAHSYAECYDLTNWRKITQDSTEFIEMYNYKICPNCKEAVERRSGCNSIICPCKQQFCFICGEKWLPNHSAHGDQACYRFKQIQALKEEQKVKKEQGKEYFMKIEELKSQLEALANNGKHIAAFEKQLKHYIKVFLKEWPIYQNQLTFIQEISSLAKRATFFAKGWKLSLHFRANELHEMRVKILTETISQMGEFLYDFVEKMGKIYEVPREDWSYYTKEEYDKQGMEESLIKKLEEHRQKMKQITDQVNKLMIIQ